MKAFILLNLLTLIGMNSLAQTTKSSSQKALPDTVMMACELTSKEQVKRMQELHQTVFKKISKTIEHQNSYELVFNDSNNAFISELTEFINFERLCCPWLVFQLTFAAKKGPVSLKMGDSPESKEMVKVVMELDKISLKH